MRERSIDLRSAQTRLAELIQQARRGEDVVLTDGGMPVAKIVAIGDPREFGSAKGLVHVADDFDAPLEDFGDYR
jgi:prevent-host-death family protein